MKRMSTVVGTAERANDVLSASGLTSLLLSLTEAMICDPNEVRSTGLSQPETY